MNDFKSLYYSIQLSDSDKEYLQKFFSKSTLQDIMSLKYCKPIEDKTLFLALKQMGLDETLIDEIKNSYFARKKKYSFRIFDEKKNFIKGREQL